MSGQTTLSTVEFEVCWDHLELGELPWVFDLPSHGRTWEERHRLADEVIAGLRSRGLAGEQGLDEHLVGRLRALAESTQCVDAWLFLDHPLRVRAAVSGRTGVLGVLGGDEVWLVGVPDHAVVGELVALLPEAGVARSPSVNLRSAAVDAAVDAVGDPARLSRELVAFGEPAADAWEFARMVEGVGYRGQFVVTVGGRRSDRVVGFHDTQRGRFLVLRRGEWTTCTPADSGRLAGAITELIAETRSTRRPRASSRPNARRIGSRRVLVGRLEDDAVLRSDREWPGQRENGNALTALGAGLFPGRERPPVHGEFGSAATRERAAPCSGHFVPGALSCADGHADQATCATANTVGHVGVRRRGNKDLGRVERSQKKQGGIHRRQHFPHRCAHLSMKKTGR